jgi:hypothetical protein
MGFVLTSSCAPLSIKEDKMMSIHETVRNQIFDATLIAGHRESTPFLSASFSIGAAFALLPIIAILVVSILSAFDDELGRSVVEFLNAAASAGGF